MLKSSELAICKSLDIDQSIHDIQLNWLSGDIRVLPSVDALIHVMQYADACFSKRRLMQVNIRGDTLSIVDGRKRRGLVGINVGRTALEIHLPARVFNRVLLNSTGGQLLLNRLLATRCQCKITSGSVVLSGRMEELELSAVASVVKVQHLSADKLNLQSISAKIDISGEFRHLQMITTGRGIHMDCFKMPERLHSVSTGAKTVVSIPDNEGFQIILKERSGAFKSEFDLTPLHEDRNYLIHKSGKSEFQVDIRGGAFHLKSRK
ncbi:DUF4097 family beta strand repeat-containing protein [Paenibacillus sp. ClWae2A]|uniref:DUF4097 family beta strand repeat-containing protein n=1 Tax=Paenibacillus sp. ClWae2A TaxID=3057177 RepID=UPI0028F5C7E0|nr:DUF4097 family beta strand repeat-containing protein [Paenibacillus sp. ClWae2A]MDT9721460.1 DUF4097 family beta strand repeat-containing protein [Paenibacillus sp. ClWae2A]